MDDELTISHRPGGVIMLTLVRAGQVPVARLWSTGGVLDSDLEMHVTAVGCYHPCFFPRRSTHPDW